MVDILTHRDPPSPTTLGADLHCASKAQSSPYRRSPTLRNLKVSTPPQTCAKVWHFCLSSVTPVSSLLCVHPGWPPGLLQAQVYGVINIFLKYITRRGFQIDRTERMQIS